MEKDRQGERIFTKKKKKKRPYPEAKENEKRLGCLRLVNILLLAWSGEFMLLVRVSLWWPSG